MRIVMMEEPLSVEVDDELVGDPEPCVESRFRAEVRGQRRISKFDHRIDLARCSRSL
jgi:hypothetical protein